MASPSVRQGAAAGSLVCVLLAATLSGCVAVKAQQRVLADTEREIDSVDNPAKREGIHTDLIRGMLAQGQYYAALAHIQAQAREAGVTPELQLLEAEARRKLGQAAEAQALYKALLQSMYIAEAYHGLGLISASSNLPVAITQLQQAVQRRPTNAVMRNDLGYALIMARRYPEALPELATAVELEAGTGDNRARNNLVLLMLVKGDEPAAQKLALESGMNEKTLAGLRQQAQGLQPKPKPAAPAPTPAPSPAKPAAAAPAKNG
ncbi:MAG: tetratricopeptide repeat protein [Panacagrimonas sp.]